MTAAPRSVTLALTGASGMAYGLRLLDCLLAARTRVALVYSQAAQIVAKQELDLALPARPQDAAAHLAERYRARARRTRW
jgi:4-hydroxy-3-polyprenylbenzoate decarboxylase